MNDVVFTVTASQWTDQGEAGVVVSLWTPPIGGWDPRNPDVTGPAEEMLATRKFCLESLREEVEVVKPEDICQWVSDEAYEAMSLHITPWED